MPIARRLAASRVPLRGMSIPGWKPKFFTPVSNSIFPKNRTHCPNALEIHKFTILHVYTSNSTYNGNITWLNLISKLSNSLPNPNMNSSCRQPQLNRHKIKIATMNINFIASSIQTLNKTSQKTQSIKISPQTCLKQNRRHRFAWWILIAAKRFIVEPKNIGQKGISRLASL